MNWKQYNWLAGCAAVLTTVAILCGGQWLWQNYTVAKPMDKAFAGIDGVVETSWDNQSSNGESMKIIAKLQNVGNLAQTYAELNNGARRILGKKPFKIEIRDSRSAQLEQFNYKAQFYVQEAIFTGNFSSMAEHLTAMAKEDDIDLRIYVDAENVYLQAKRNTAEMYVVVPRQGESQEVK